MCAYACVGCQAELCAEDGNKRTWAQVDLRHGSTGLDAVTDAFDAVTPSCSASALGAVINMNAHVINVNAGAPSGQIHDAIHDAIQHAVPPDQEKVQKSRDGCSGSQPPILQKWAHDEILNLFLTLREVFVHKT
jgi:hypothetical protein